MLRGYQATGSIRSTILTGNCSSKHKDKGVKRRNCLIASYLPWLIHDGVSLPPWPGYFTLIRRRHADGLMPKCLLKQPEKCWLVGKAISAAILVTGTD